MWRTVQIGTGLWSRAHTLHICMDVTARAPWLAMLSNSGPALEKSASLLSFSRCLKNVLLTSRWSQRRLRSTSWNGKRRRKNRGLLQTIRDAYIINGVIRKQPSKCTGSLLYAALSHNAPVFSEIRQIRTNSHWEHRNLSEGAMCWQRQRQSLKIPLRHSEAQHTKCLRDYYKVLGRSSAYCSRISFGMFCSTNVLEQIVAAAR